MAVDVDRAFRGLAGELERMMTRRFPRHPAASVEDACAQAWMIAWRYRERIDPRNLIGWLFVVARHELYAITQRRAGEVLHDAVDHHGGEASYADPELALEAQEALRGLAALRPHQRRALALQVAGFSYAEIRELEQVTQTWVNRHVSEGRCAVRAVREGGESA